MTTIKVIITTENQVSRMDEDILQDEVKKFLNGRKITIKTIQVDSHVEGNSAYQWQ